MKLILFLGINQNPKSYSSRLIIASTYILGIVLVSAYSAKLVSILSFEIISFPFKNIEEFNKDGSYMIGAIRDTPTHMLLKVINLI